MDGVGVRNLYFLCLIFPAPDDGEVLNHCATRLVRHDSRPFVADPTVHPPATRVHPQQVLEPEIV